MILIRKLLFIITIPVIVFFIQELFAIADDNWQLDGSIELSDAEEIELGKSVNEYIRHQFYLRNDPELSKELNDITQRLTAVSDRKTLPFTCDIIQSYSINAFSAPGGHIYITEGLLKFAETEDEIAGIIGHEVAHASLRHVSKLYREFIEIISQREKGTDSVATLLLFNCHLEEFEQEADTTGVLYSHKAGFNPNGLPDFLERHLNLLIRNGVFGFLRFGSYTTISSRINHMREYISSLTIKE
ncbi:MAG TPA: M48 family metalloprotease [Candidatus Wunengus sp. YC60]|uniref:M48 family metalloprotease n=1 Tax=Candidatus Wunengus sp. YC60 TaxID=3367697 RepID=UPI004028B1CB